MKEQSDEHYQFRPGWALIINGGPESGKERLARKIAINHGRYREMQASALDKRDGISAMTALDCETVIIHGIPATPAATSAIETMIAASRFNATTEQFDHANRWHKHLIFCVDYGRIVVGGITYDYINLPPR